MPERHFDRRLLQVFNPRDAEAAGVADAGGARSLGREQLVQLAPPLYRHWEKTMKPMIALAICSLAVASGCAELGTRAVHCDVGPVSVDDRAHAKSDEINVYGENKWICWTLTKSTYRFQPDSIQIDDPKADAFANCKKGDKNGELDGPDLIRCKDKNPYPARYKYEIRLYDQNGNPGPRYDPWVVNN